MGARTATTGITANVAGVIFQSEERMFKPGLANLFKPLGIICPAAHPIKVLRNDWVIGIWQLKPIDGLVAIITRSCRDSETDLRPSAPEFFYVW